MKKMIFAVIGVCCLMLSTQAFATCLQNPDLLATYNGSDWTITENRYNFDPPEWRDNFNTLYVDNEAYPDLYKIVCLEIDFILFEGSFFPEMQIPELSLVAAGTVYDVDNWLIVDPIVDPSAPILGTWTWIWEIHPQPASEIIDFSAATGWDFGNMFVFSGQPFSPPIGIIESVTIGTQCVPEPSTFVLLAFGFLGILGRNRLRRQS